MGRIADSLITKGGTDTESYYDYLVSRYIAPFFTLFFKRIGLHNPNIVTFLSFLLIIIPSIMIFFFALLDSIAYRFLIAILIQVSFAFDCSDGQLARITGQTSQLGAWLDRVLDRAGEFIIFVCFGLMAWWQYDELLLLFLGVLTGYGLSLFTMAMSISESMQFRNVNEMIHIKDNDNKKELPIEKSNRKKGKKELVFSLLSKVFFFLNFGIGERYLYLSFFIIINRVDIMLYISSFLTTLRFLSISHYMGRKLMKYDRLNNDPSSKGN